MKIKDAALVHTDTARTQIMDAARLVFSKYGFRKTTLDDIAAIIGKRKSSLYYYFKSKEEIFEAVLEIEILIMKDELLDAVKKERTPRAKFRRYILKRMELFHKLVNFYSAIQKEYIEHLSFIEKIREKYDEQEILIISDILEEGIRKKIFTVVDVRLTSFVVILAMKGFEYPFTKEKDISQLESDIDRLLNMLFYGLLPRKK